MPASNPFMGIVGPIFMILLILAFMGVAEPARYFRLSNLNQILLDAALYMPMAMAMTFVITQRGIDLSIGSVAALSAIVMAFLIKQFGYPAWLAGHDCACRSVRFDGPGQRSGHHPAARA